MNKKKLIIRKRIRKSFLIIIVIIILSVMFRNQYYNYKLNNYKDDNIQIIDSENIDVNDNNPKNLEELSDSNSKIKKIMENRDSYPEILLEMLSRNLDMTDYVFNYLELKGKVFDDKIDEFKKGEYPLLLQYDTRWGYGIYGDDVLAINGCGPTSVAMVIAGLTGKNNITPYDVAKYSYQNGYYIGGTSWSFFTEGVKHFGIVGTELSLSKSAMISELENGHPIILSVRKGDFTTTGHIIVVAGLKDGNFIINDPNSKERSNKLWSYDRIKNQIKNLWSFELI